jgi:AcrR family transcriptional regulator
VPNATTRPRRTQAERTALSEDRLLEAALKLLAERGYDRTSLQAIGEEAGYSRGLVSHRFGSKEGLLWAIFERTFGEWKDRSLTPRIGARVGLDALHATLEASRAALKRSPGRIRAFYALLFQTAGPLRVLRAKVADLHRRERKAVAALIAAGVENGTIRPDVDPSREAALFIGMLRGATYQWLIDPRGVDIDALYDAIDDTVGRALGRSPGLDRIGGRR